MKKLIFLSFFCLHFINVNAQAWIYHPMPDSNAVWNIYNINSLNDPCDIFDYRSYYLGADTILNTYSYNKLSVNGHRYSNCPGLDYFYNDLKYIRQDILNKRVYLNINGIDTLLYEFNLNLGDTLPPCYPYGTSAFQVVTNIDSVFVGQFFRKRYSITATAPTGQQYEIIEGIGSDIGLIPDFNTEFIFTNLLCFSVNNIGVFPNTNASCEIFNSTNKYSDISDIIVQILPNPVSENGTIKIFSPKNYNCEIVLNSLFGKSNKILYTGKLYTGNNSILMNVSDISSGIFTLQLKISESKETINKLIEIVH